METRRLEEDRRDEALGLYLTETKAQRVSVFSSHQAHLVTQNATGVSRLGDPGRSTRLTGGRRGKRIHLKASAARLTAPERESRPH